MLFSVVNIFSISLQSGNCTLPNLLQALSTSSVMEVSMEICSSVRMGLSNLIIKEFIPVRTLSKCWPNSPISSEHADVRIVFNRADCMFRVFVSKSAALRFEVLELSCVCEVEEMPDKFFLSVDMLFS